MTRKIVSLCISLILLFTIIFCFSGCTDKTMAREWGGSTTLELPKGEKLIEITWKDANLWYLTRPMRDDEFPETYTFQEDSEFGIFEGTVTIIESR